MPLTSDTSGDSVSLRDHLTTIIEGVDQRSHMRDQAIKEAMDKFEAALNVRLESMNGFRAQLSAQRAEFATNERLDDTIASTRSLYDALVTSINTATDTLRVANEHEIEALRDRFDRDEKALNTSINLLSQQVALCVTNDKLEAMRSAGEERGRAILDQLAAESGKRDDAIGQLQQGYAGLVGRISGMGIAAILISLGLQIVLYIVTHGSFP